MTAHIRIATPTDVLDAVPALLRFYPTESLVGLFLEHTPVGTLPAVTARFDLPEQAADTLAMIAQIVEMLTRHPEAIFVLYTADQDEARTAMQALLSHLDPTQVRLAILATLPGWTTVDPEQPHTIAWTNPYPTSTGTVAAELAHGGKHAMGTRDDLADSIAAPDAATTEDYALGRSLDPLPANPTRDQMATLTEDVVRWVAGYLSQPTTVIAEEAAYVAARIHHHQPRDAMLALVDRSNGNAIAAMWQAIAALTPDEDALPVLACLGLTAWIGGDGALANVAIDRARPLGDGPGASLRDLVAELLNRQVHHALWEQLRPGQ